MPQTARVDVPDTGVGNIPVTLLLQRIEKTKKHKYFFVELLCALNDKERIQIMVEISI